MNTTRYFVFAGIISCFCFFLACSIYTGMKKILCRKTQNRITSNESIKVKTDKLRVEIRPNSVVLCRQQ